MNEAAKPARVVAGRYGLKRCLGRGGQGEVWGAEDRLTSSMVAVKLLEEGEETEPARVRREVSALRLLRLPGVVRLLDEGSDAGAAFIVMELIEGAPFPGAMGPHAWTDIARVTFALVETLARIHTAGVVHRDLKPANVLVTAAGVPTVLDFGLSTGRTLGAGLTRRGELLGTPAYLAPEQIFGESITPRTDLYALGVMLYESLSGKLPHEGDSMQSLLVGRLGQRPRPLREIAPDVPPTIAGLVDLLLARSPEDRPRSAGDVLAVLRGQPAAALDDPTLPRLGGAGVVDAILDAARSGRSLDIVGASGSGRTRALRDAMHVAVEEGKSIVWLSPDRRPFGSVAPIVGDLDGLADTRLRDVVSLVEDKLSSTLGRGTVIIADDAEHIDALTSRALRRAREHGSVIRAFLDPPPEDVGASAVRLGALDEADLRPLFTGMDRLFHLPSDAAHALWERTHGLPARVVEEVTAWIRAGVARRDEHGWTVDRDALDRLAAGLRIAPGGAGERGPAVALPPHLEELCAWVGVAWPSARPEQLARAMALPVWRVEAEIDDLCRRGVASVRSDGRVELLHAGHDGWAVERRRTAHRAMAAILPEGDEGRLIHLLAGGDSVDPDAVARETSALGRSLAQRGHLGRATAALSEGLLAVRRAASEGSGERLRAEPRVLATWVEVALSEGTPEAQDRVLYELSRAGRSDAVTHLEDLVRAYLAFSAGGERGFELSNAIPPFADPDLERRRQGVRVLAARRCSLADEEALLGDLSIWALESGDPHTEARCAGWLGRLRYRQGRFVEAAELHTRAAEGEPWTAARIAARINAASALMEAFRYDEAARWAEEAREGARACRHPFYEGRAEWIARSTAYRSGLPASPDMDLIEAVARLGVNDLEGAVCMTEAAFAYRAGSMEEAAMIADRGARAWVAIGLEGPHMLVRALALACGAVAKEGEIDDLAARAMRCPTTGLGLQALALLAEATGGARPGWDAAAEALLEGIPRERYGVRMDVLSAGEALARTRAAGIRSRSRGSQP